MATYAKQALRFGLGGLDIRRTVDLVDNLNATRLTNAVRLPDGGLTSRLGQTLLATGGSTPLHSILRAVDPQSGVTDFLWGVGTTLQHGTSGALSNLATGFSGNPLSLAPWRVQLSGQSWVIVADGNKMVKVRISDGLVLPIGLPAQAAVCTTALATEKTVAIDAFTSGFTGHAGVGGSGVPSAAPTLLYIGTRNSCLNFLPNPGAEVGPYYSFADKAITKDLSTFGGGLDATDDDLIHLELWADHPEMIGEVRVYFTTYGTAGATTTFTAGKLPGANPGYNESGFYKAFRPSDSTAIIGGANTIAVLPTIAANNSADDAVRATPDFNGDTVPTTTEVTTNTTSNAATPSSQSVAGSGAWTEWGTVGIPLRRGDFQAFGGSTNGVVQADWSKVIGLTVYVNKLSNVGAASVEFNNCYLTGGYGPDTTEPGSQKYDYLCTNYDPRTGAEGNGGNPTYIMAETNWLDAQRRAIVVTPPAHSDSAMRQRIYRRGGVLTDNWRFVGVNTSNGGALIDTLSDLQISTADTVVTDHFAAVPSITSAGAASLAKPVPYVWGPLQGILFASGDPNRPGSVYYCYPDAVDHWGANGYIDVSSPAEAIVGGFLLGSQAFAWSTQRLYALNINLSDNTSVYSTITQCTRAPISPWAHAIGQGVDWFCAADGIFATDGGIEVNVSDGWIRPLFQGQAANGLFPIDITQTTKTRLQVYQNELHFFYQDTNGNRQSLIYHLNDKIWRHATYDVGVNVAYADTTTGIGRLIFGGTNGKAYTYSGTSDDGAAITATHQFPAFNQGYPKSQKRYSDFTIDADCNGNTVTITPYSDYDQVTSAPLVLAPSTGRQPSIYSFADPLLSTTLGLRSTWSTASTPPVLYTATLTFELEPPTITSWTCLPTDHGIPGWSFPTSLFLTLRSSAMVTITVTAYGQTGTPTVKHYTVPATAGAKIKRWVPFEATKGALYDYKITSLEPFVLYSPESTLTVQKWGSAETSEVRLINLLNEGSTNQTTLDPRAAITAGG